MSTDKKGLVIYGDPATGKSTLELNLRRWYFRSPMTEDDFQCDGRVCFFGKTAKRGPEIMSTGGAEALTSLSNLPEAEWYIAALPTKGREGAKLSRDFFASLCPRVYAIYLYTNNVKKYKEARTRFFSGRGPAASTPTRAPARSLPFVPDVQSRKFSTENLYAAFSYAMSLLGVVRSYGHVRSITRIMTLEEIGTHIPFFVEGLCVNCEEPLELCDCDKRMSSTDAAQILRSGR